MNRPWPDNDRMLELLADRALYGLSDAESAELRDLLAQHGLTGEEDAFESAAAAAALALQPDVEPMPGPLRRRLETAADDFLSGVAAPASVRLADQIDPGPGPAVRPTRTPVRGVPFIHKLGWLAAAACLALAVWAWMPAGRSSPTRQRDTFIASAPDLLRLSWGDFNALDTQEPSEVKGVQGEVVWSDRAQRGFMTFKNLPGNDPVKEQYQLWIVDAARGLSQRVDGGVFDAAGPGEIVIPINAKLPIHSAAGFAVTIERPGGVVISDMKRRVVLALKS